MSSETLVFDATWTEDGEQRDGGVRRPGRAVAAEDVPVFANYALQDQYDAMRIVGERTDVPVPAVGLDGADRRGARHAVLPDGPDRRASSRPTCCPTTSGDNWLFDASRRGPAPAAGQHRRGDRRAARDPGRQRRRSPSSTARHGRGETPLARNLARTRAWYEFAVPDIGRSPIAERGARLARGQPARHHRRDGAVLGRLADRQRALPRLRAGRRPRLGDGRDRPARDGRVLDGLRAQVFESITGVLEMPGMPHFLREEDVKATYAELTGVQLGDLTWYHLYNAVQWCIVFMRTGARQIHFGEIERPDDIETLFHHKPLIERLLDGGRRLMRGRPARRVPDPPGCRCRRLGGQQRPQLLRPLLLQRPRPHRRHLPDHRARLLPEPRHQGRLRPGPPRRQADRRPPLRRDRRRPAQPARRRLPGRGRRAAATSCASCSRRPRASPST